MMRKDKKEGGSLYTHCRLKLKHRSRPVGDCRSTISDRISISERPAEVDGVRFGDFEMDIIVGKGNKGAILTLTTLVINMLRKLLTKLIFDQEKSNFSTLFECFYENIL